MTVRELMEKLMEFDSDLPVVIKVDTTKAHELVGDMEGIAWDGDGNGYVNAVLIQ